MSRTLVLEVPEAVYEALKTAAQSKGQAPEAAGVEWLEHMARLAAEDPLEPWIGAFESGIPGWSLRHHELLGEALMRECNGNDEEPTP
ncbi:MAG: hypothetical protein HY321_02155 [Armatimonadetes bacterium]|nr:hypothetical protein [Armatimonadota bacterium]